MAENKKTLTVTLEVKELIYDIQNKAYLTGQTREASGIGYQVASNLQPSDDEENSYQICRSLSNAFSSIKSVLGEYLNEDKTTSNNLIYEEIENKGQLSLAFLLPTNYNDSSSESLVNGIHAYLVAASLGDWFAITNKEDAQTYIADSAVSLDRVRRALYKRCRPSRPNSE